jgi:TolB-like protein/tetratricopeptide (TPR) repeat protein
MSGNHSFLAAVLAELSRRKVLRTMGAYAVAVFAVLQLMDAAVEPLRLPEWLPTVVVLTLILGFPIVFLLAWQFDVTSGGIRKTKPAGFLTRPQSVMMFSLMFIGTAGLGLGFYQYYSNVFATDAQQTAQSFVEQRTFSAPENSIAVLPFVDLSAAGDQAHFSDGIAEEILNLLAQVDGLHVAARTSSFAFRDPQKDIRDIGQLLNVGTILEGSIRTAGNRIRMTAQLINVEDGYHIWSQSFDRELNDVFAIQDEVASAIAAALVDSFAGLTQKPAGRTRNLAAFEAYRTGRLHWWRRTPQEIQKAIELFAKALEHDPQYAPAYAAIADSLVLLSLYGNITQMKAIERAQPMIEKALAIDPESAEAFAALGLARLQIGQTDSAESALRQAVSLNEDYIPAHLWLASLLGTLGRIPEEGLVLQRAMAIDPLNELLVVNYAGNLIAQGDYDSAREMMSGLIQIKPDSSTLLRSMSGFAAGHGDLVEAWDFARRSFELEPESPAVISTMAQIWLELEDYEHAEQVLKAGLELAEDNRDLKIQYFSLMLLSSRMEEAERMVVEQFGEDISGLPEQFQRFYHLQMGMIHLMNKDLIPARDEFEQALNPDESQVFDGGQVTILIMASYLNDLLGDTELAEERLQTAERAVRRARINGIDHAYIYYNETSIYALRGETEKALEALQEAYNRGWRQSWILEIDERLESLWEEPEFMAINRDINDYLIFAKCEFISVNVVMN